MNQKSSNEFSKKLLKCREERGLSQRDFARFLGVDQAQICRWESISPPNRLRQEHLARLLGFSLPHYCVFKKCPNLGECVYLISRATLPEELQLYNDFRLYLCDTHFAPFKNMGMDVFCEKYGFSARLELARKLFKDYEEMKKRE